ncbi:MAG: hypothetical protein K2V38_12970, partial [Gemmataceae bacterium]|nr:hypothetical protein [Gemmataceae bacterium]
VAWHVVETVAGQDFSSPFTGILAPDGNPWVAEGIKEAVRVKLGLSRRQVAQPTGPGTDQPGGPATPGTPGVTPP